SEHSLPWLAYSQKRTLLASWEQGLKNFNVKASLFCIQNKIFFFASGTFCIVDSPSIATGFRIFKRNPSIYIERPRHVNKRKTSERGHFIRQICPASFCSFLLTGAAQSHPTARSVKNEASPRKDQIRRSSSFCDLGREFYGRTGSTQAAC
ncbi:MAG TPA: hypothetical protein VH724_08385, partial [Candidatus Angelobacter sp.]|nr:hypothetical protein [Candidatus Angelobacter sp.]